MSPPVSIPPKATILVIGSLNKDLITRTARVPDAGETLIATSFETGSGGKGANQAVACARLVRRRRRRAGRGDGEGREENEEQGRGGGGEGEGEEEEGDAIKVQMIGAVGSDVFGSELLTSLRSNGVDTSSVLVRDDVSTGVAVVLVDDTSGENRILVSPDNANYSLRPGDFEGVFTHDHDDNNKNDREGEKGNDIRSLSRPHLILLQLEIQLETTLRIIELAKAANVPVLLNPAPAPAGGLPRGVYRGLTHLVLNESEAEILSRALDKDVEEITKEKEKREHPSSRPPQRSGNNSNSTTTTTTTNLASLAQQFLDLGVENVVITLGARGAYYATFSSSSSSSSSSSGLEPPRTAGGKIHAIDTTGAGDTFVGTYAVRLVEGAVGIKDAVEEDRRARGLGSEGAEGERAAKRKEGIMKTELKEIVAWANLAAGKSVQRKGAQGGMPFREEMDEDEDEEGLRK